MDWEKIAQSAERLLGRQLGVCVLFKLDGVVRRGCRTSLRREDVNTDAGLADAYSFSLLCPYSQFVGAEMPKPRTSKANVDGVEYRVLGLETDAAKATLKIHLGEVLA